MVETTSSSLGVIDSAWSLLRKSFRENGLKTAAIIEGKTFTYGDLDESSERMARWLSLQALPGERVALLMGNSYEYLVADIALHRAALVKVPLNPMLSIQDMTHIVSDAGAHLLLTTTAEVPDPEGLFASLAEAGNPTVFDVTTDAFRTELASSATGQSERDARGFDLACILYTGGTTGRPKGVAHTRQSVALNLVSHIIEGDIGRSDVMLLASALSHSAGLFAMGGLIRGATLVVERRFSAPAFLRTISAEHVTWTSLVPTMLYRLIDAIAESGEPAPKLSTIVYGSAPITTGRLLEAIDLFGPVFIQLYGQTEVPNFGTTLTKEDHAALTTMKELWGSCGRSSLMAEVAVVDETGKQLVPGESGEICIRAPYMMDSYFNNPAATAKSLVNGWVHTRDVGYLDAAGYLFIQDRISDMIISGGYNVYCSEVETQLQTIDGVAQVAVIGLPDPDWGEKICAVVVRRSSAYTLTEASVMNSARALLGGYKRPKVVKFVDELPLTPFGKADKKLLRERFRAESEEQV